MTGHTGFKGPWLAPYLSEMRTEAHCLGLDPVSEISLYSELRLLDSLASDSRIDSRDYTRVHEAIRQFRPVVIVNLLAQPIVGDGYRSPIDTPSTNVMGTANRFKATWQLGKGTAFISVVTGKAYASNGGGQTFAEHDALRGKDPYGATKAAADIVSQMVAEAGLSEIGVAVDIVLGSWLQISSWVEEPEKEFGEVKDLLTDSSRATKALGIEPFWQSTTSIERPIVGYSSKYSGASAKNLSLPMIRLTWGGNNV